MKTLSNEITLNLAGDADVSVKAFIAPIKHTLSNFHVEWEALANLRVAEPEKRHPISIFQSFLPTGSVSVGECWQIEETGVMELLRQLNPNPNLDMHLDSGDSRSLWGCLRAYNDQFADIAFRVHAEFKLEDGWLTPSQFAGNLVIDRLEGKIAFLEMSVPAGHGESRYRLERRQSGILFYYGCRFLLANATPGWGAGCYAGHRIRSSDHPRSSRTRVSRTVLQVRTKLTGYPHTKQWRWQKNR